MELSPILTQCPGTPTHSCNLKYATQDGVHPVCQYNLAIVHLLESFVREGDSVLDLGCGCGLFGLHCAASKASVHVTYADIDQPSVGCAQKSAEYNGFEDRSSFVVGDWLSPFVEDNHTKAKFDLVVCNPPQTPSPKPIRLDKYGGDHGNSFHLKLAESSKALIKPGGRIVFMACLVADMKPVIAEYEKNGFKVTATKALARSIPVADYRRIEDGLFEYLLEERKRGRSEFEVSDDGEWIQFNSVLYCADKINKPAP